MKSDLSTRVAMVLALAILLMALVAAQSASPIHPYQAPDNRATAHQPLVALGPAPAVKFARGVAYGSGGFFASSVAIADVNGDGKPDLVVANACQTGSDGQSDCSIGAVGVLLGNGDGSMQTVVSYSSGGVAAASVAIADLNGDGHPDLVVANQCISAADCSNGVVGVLLGNGDGTFRPAVTYVAGNAAQAVAVADLNRDGFLDLVVANQCMSADSCANGGVSVLLGNGNGTFRPPTTYSSGGQNAEWVAIEDVNGDGFPDVITANQCISKFNCNNGGVSVMLGNGDGTLKSASSYSSGGYSALSIAVGDVNGDGRPDIVATSLCSQSADCVEGVVGVLVSNGNGTFKPPVTYSSGGYGASSVAIGDLNGDGIPDLVVDNICKTSANCTKGGVSLLLGNGGGTFQTPLIYSSYGNNASSVTLGNLNGDGKLDVATADKCLTKTDCSGTAVVLLNSSIIKTTTTLSSSINPSLINQQVVFTATIVSSPSIPDGEIVTFYHGKTVLGSGTIANDVATLTTSFAEADSYIIKATYAGDAFHKKSSGTITQMVGGVTVAARP